MGAGTTEFFVLSTMDEALRRRIAELKPMLLAEADATGAAKTAVTVNGMGVGNVVAAFKDGPKVADPEAFGAWEDETLHGVDEWDVDLETLSRDPKAWGEFTSMMRERFPQCVFKTRRHEMPEGAGYTPGPGGCVLYGVDGRPDSFEVVPGMEWEHRAAYVRATDVRANRKPDPARLAMAMGGDVAALMDGSMFAALPDEVEA